MDNKQLFTFQPQDNIWKPDISLRNTLKTFTGLGSSYLNVYVLHNGIVEWNPYQVNCGKIKTSYQIYFNDNFS